VVVVVEPGLSKSSVIPNKHTLDSHPNLIMARAPGRKSRLFHLFHAASYCEMGFAIACVRSSRPA
jgi:hypothetical protein